jgi:hypothetical protein
MLKNMVFVDGLNSAGSKWLSEAGFVKISVNLVVLSKTGNFLARRVTVSFSRRTISLSYLTKISKRGRKIQFHF